MYGFIVEGFNDERKLKSLYPDVYIVETQGTRLDNRVRMKINSAIEKCKKVFILTDPDTAGDLFASRLLVEYPNLPRIRLSADKCMCYRNHKLKIGVEHCDNEYLNSVLKPYLLDDKIS